MSGETDVEQQLGGSHRADNIMDQCCDQETSGHRGSTLYNVTCLFVCLI